MNKILLLFLLCPSLVFAEVDFDIVVNKDGKSFYVEKHKIGNQTFRRVNWEKTKSLNYKAVVNGSAAVRSASLGVESAAAVGASIEGQIAKKTVLRNLLARSITYGSKVGWLGVGATVVGSLAWDLVVDKLSDKGYKWSAAQNNFVTDKEYKYCLSNRVFSGSKFNDVEVECIGVDAISKGLYERDTVESINARDKMCQKHWQELLPDYPPSHGYHFESSAAYGCTISSPKDNGRTSGSFDLKKVNDTSITQSQFDDIIGPYADKSPSPYVQATADDKGSIPGLEVSDDIDIADGTIAQTRPYTNPETGEAEQTEWRFSQNQGRTTVTESVKKRPDLTPNSKEAPKPDKQKDADKTENKDGKDETKKEDDKKDNKPESGLCDMFPGILACDKMGDVDEHDAPFNVPHVTNDTTFKPDYFLPDTGVCPSPESFTFWGKTYYLSYEPICRFAGMIRYLIIGVAGFIAARIMFSGLKQG